ncbi:LOW QUALITY PROTEIN: acyl-coenzyme A thioesterase THEM5 [Trichechus inunguis]
MMRRAFHVAARLGHHRALPGAPHILPRLNPSSALGSSKDALVSRFSQKTDFKDYTLPNASWYPEMLSMYQEFLEKTKTSSWTKIPSFKSNREHFQKLWLELAVTSNKGDNHVFTRCTQEEGQGYESVVFFHRPKKKSVCLFQPGPYLEGPPPRSKVSGRARVAHGGSLAAMMDEVSSKMALLAEEVVTGSLNIRFRNPLLMGSLAVLTVEVEKVEDRKVYLSCIAQSRDQQTVYATSSGKEVLSLRPYALSCHHPPQNKRKGGRRPRIQSQAGVLQFRAVFLRLRQEETSSQLQSLCLQDSLPLIALPACDPPQIREGSPGSDW